MDNQLFGFFVREEEIKNEALKKVVDSKRVPSAYSMHASGASYATISVPMANALVALWQMKRIIGDGGIGERSGSSIVEHHVSSEICEIAKLDYSTGLFRAVVYNKEDDVYSPYVLPREKSRKKSNGGELIWMALYPLLMRDPEFNTQFDTFCACGNADFSDAHMSKKTLAILCDNIYRTIKQGGIELTIEESLTIPTISETMIAGGTLTPETVVIGTMPILSGTVSDSVRISGVKSVKHEAYYPLSERELSSREKLLVPALPEWYVMPQQVVDAVLHASETTISASPMRNFMFRGAAGSGKTKAAIAFASLVQRPYVSFTCSSNTEIFDFIGQMIPCEANGEKMPTMKEARYDPYTAYAKLTGSEFESENYEECSKRCIEIMKDNAMITSATGQRYKYVVTDFLNAIKNGWVVEIQEPNVIAQPGVLTGLNALLEGEQITLLTGEVIKRHPDAVVIVTTNVDYEGCRDMNQSVVDRMDMVFDMNTPTKEIMFERAKEKTGFEDDQLLAKMVDVTCDISEWLANRSITDGTCGMRSLLAWVESVKITNNPYRSAQHTIISKTTNSADDRDSVSVSILERTFPRN